MCYGTETVHGHDARGDAKLFRLFDDEPFVWLVTHSSILWLRPTLHHNHRTRLCGLVLRDKIESLVDFGFQRLPPFGLRSHDAIKFIIGQSGWKLEFRLRIFLRIDNGKQLLQGLAPRKESVLAKNLKGDSRNRQFGWLKQEQRWHSIQCFGIWLPNPVAGI